MLHRDLCRDLLRCINYFDMKMGWLASLHTTKLVELQIVIERIQWGLDHLQAVKCQMEFNPNRHKVLNFAWLDVKGKYTINGKTLNSIDIQNLGGSNP